MDGPEFTRALAAGLGRALRDARDVPESVRRDCLLQASSRHQAWDPQLSSPRGRWLARVLEASGDMDILAPQVLAVLAATPDEYEFHHDVAQMSELAVAFARRGIAGAREALYAAHDRQNRDVWMAVRESIVALDGLTGFEWIARKLGARVRSDPELHVDEWFVIHSRNEIGEREFDEWFDRVARVDAEVAAFHARVQPDLDDRYARMAKPYDLNSYSDEARHKIAFWWNYRFEDVRNRLLESSSEATRFHWASSWAHHCANDADIDALFAALATETDRRILIGILGMFDTYPHGKIEQRLLERRVSRHFELLDHDDEDVSFRAHCALKGIASERIHDIVVARLESGRCDGNTLQLMYANFAADDAARIRRALPKSGDLWETQDVAYDLIRVLELHATRTEFDLVEWCYEWAASELSRSDAVDLLMKLDVLSPGIADEARYDSCEYVRAAIAHGPVTIDAPLPPE